MAKSKKSSETVVVDRRGGDRRDALERRQKNIPVDAERRVEARRKAPRRRQIDPTTCERDYTSEEIEFMQAMDAYKRANGRMFPTCSEILEVVRNMGYVRVASPILTDSNTAPTTILDADVNSTSVQPVETSPSDASSPPEN